MVQPLNLKKLHLGKTYWKMLQIDKEWNGFLESMTPENLEYLKYRLKKQNNRLIIDMTKELGYLNIDVGEFGDSILIDDLIKKFKKRLIK